MDSHLHVHTHVQKIYRIAGNFGEVFNLANWRVCGKLPNLKLAKYRDIYVDVYM